MIHYLLKNIKIISISKTWILINAFLLLIIVSFIKSCFNLFLKKPFNFGLRKIAKSFYSVWKIK